MRRFAPFLLLVFLAIGAFAQNISVKTFQALPMDMTASSLEGKRTDQNGNVAALIKIVTSETGFTFEGGALGIVDSQQRNGEIWVWVPYGLRKITILHQKLGVLRDYRFPVEIQAERTYEMVLTTAKMITTFENEVREQYLMFQITPPDAMLEVNDQIWEVGSDGTAMKFVSFGTYSYRVQAPNYHADAGSVVVNDPTNTQTVTVELKPNFGYIEVKGTGSLQGASVYIDNALVGKAPCKSGILKSGRYNVRIAKEMYDTYSEAVTVNDNETTTLSPTLKANFAKVTLTVDSEAEIWVNDEKKGVKTWTGALGSGTYKIECKQASHETSLTTQEITPNMDGETITLSAPRPIYGSLNVESSPLKAKIFIDDKEVGTTPKFISEILIGNHTLRLALDGYADHTETISINKGERKQVKPTLNKNQEVQVAQYAQKSNNNEQKTVPTQGLIAYYPFDGNANDYSGNGKHATPKNDYRYEKGVVGQAIHLQGKGQWLGGEGGFVKLPTIQFEQSGFTLNLWVKAEGLTYFHGETYITFGDEQNEKEKLNIIQNPDNVLFTYHDVTITTKFNQQNKWAMYTLTCTQDGKLVAYINGNKVGEKNVKYNVNIDTSLSGLGGHWWAKGKSCSTRFIGSIDEVRLYNRAISEQEIQKLYNIKP